VNSQSVNMIPLLWSLAPISVPPPSMPSPSGRGGAYTGNRPDAYSALADLLEQDAEPVEQV